ncbi:MAG: PQQ-binding-like beta-propeller repeat protein [Blastocatellia bacterium]
MRISINPQFCASILASILALIFLVPSLAQTQSSPTPESGQTKKEKKAEAKRKGGLVAEQEARTEPGAISTSQLALPFKRAWQYLTDGATSFAPAVDDARIYLPLAGGRVVCMDRQTGTSLWTGELGGVITASPAAGESSVYISTHKIADDGSEAGGSLRAVDKATGLTVWVKDYPRPFASPLELGAERLYAGSEDGSLYALDLKNGDIVWKVDTQGVVHSRVLANGEMVYFGSDDGGLRAVEPVRGQLLWKFQAGGKVVGQPAIDERSLYFGAGDGYLYSIDRVTGKLRWRSRTGAAVEATPVVAGGRVLVASFDNFVYALSRATGDRIWKRRLENRIASAPIVEGDASLVAPLRGDYVAVLLNSDGRRVNLFQLEKDFEIVADPVVFGEMLVVATNKGLVVAAASRPEGSQTRAIKK